MYLVVSTAQHELWLGRIRKSRYISRGQKGSVSMVPIYGHIPSILLCTAGCGLSCWTGGFPEAGPRRDGFSRSCLAVALNRCNSFGKYMEDLIALL